MRKRGVCLLIASSTWNRSFAPGLSKLWWSSQGIVEYFVRECRGQADRLQSIVDEFKYGVQYIEHHCSVIANTLVVSIEKKKVYKVDVFEQRQAEHQENIRKKLKKVHQEILVTMKKLFDFFRIDYSVHDTIRVEWHRFVEKIEKEIEDSLKLMVKKSLQEIERSLGNTKEEDKTSEGPLFILEVVLETAPTETKPRAEARPSILSLSQKIIGIAKEVISVVAVMPRLEEALTKVVDSETDQELEEKKLIRVKHQSPNQDTQLQDSYYNFMTGESETLLFIKQIQNSFSAIGDEVKAQLINKMHFQNESKDITTSLWSSKDHLLSRAKKAWKLNDYKSNIDAYKSLDSKTIAGWDATVDCLFVRLDYTPMKTRLRTQCQYWVTNILESLNSQARSDLDGFYQTFDTYIDKLSKQPRTLDHLGEQLSLSTKVTAELPLIEQRFEPLNDQYEMLEQYQVDDSGGRTKEENGTSSAL